MNILIYHKADGSIRRITECKPNRRHTRKQIAERIIEFNRANPDNWVEFRRVSKKYEDIFRDIVSDDLTLMKEQIIHDAYDYAESGRYIYDICKCKGHGFPIVHIMKVVTPGKFRVAELRHEEGELPIAWCYCSDLMKLLGLSQSTINKLSLAAESVAWGWYKKISK